MPPVGLNNLLKIGLRSGLELELGSGVVRGRVGVRVRGTGTGAVRGRVRQKIIPAVFSSFPENRIIAASLGIGSGLGSGLGSGPSRS